MRQSLGTSSAELHRQVRNLQQRYAQIGKENSDHRAQIHCFLPGTHD